MIGIMINTENELYKIRQNFERFHQYAGMKFEGNK